MVRTTTIAAAVGIACLAAAPTSALADSFNLTCAGTLRTLAPATLTDTTAPYSYVYRIDLDAKRWCDGACLAPRDIAEVSPVIITLEQKKIDTPREHDEMRNLIFRQTGGHSITSESGVGRLQIAIFWKGQCEKGEFTGFPKIETKF